MYYFWNVQLAKKFEINEIKDNEWFSLSEKINGVRGTYYGGKIYSRQGNVISGLDHIISDIKKLNLPDMVFDGELVRDNVNNLSDNANFRLSNGIIQSNEKIKSEIKFVIFDMIPIKEFDQGKSNKKYKERLNDLLSINFQGSIEFVPIIYSGSDKSNIFNLLDKVVSEGKEGLILNRDTEYLRKRNSGILRLRNHIQWI